MKQTLSFLLAAILLLSALCGCREKNTFPENVTCEDIMKAVQSAGDVPEAEKVYLSGDNNLDATLMSLWADGLYEECSEFELISDYAIFLCAGTDTYEIAVLKARDEGGVSKLTKLIERRKETLAVGDKGAYDPKFDMRMENSVLYSDGLFVIFIVTDYNENAVEAIKNLKK